MLVPAQGRLVFRPDQQRHRSPVPIRSIIYRRVAYIHRYLPLLPLSSSVRFVPNTRCHVNLNSKAPKRPTLVSYLQRSVLTNAKVVACIRAPGAANQLPLDPAIKA
jgi:hypothetical protein